MSFRFDGKRILVTGAGKGIGRNVVADLVNAGAEVFALSRTKSDLDSLKEELPSVHTILCDIANWDVTREIVQGILPIHHLVNNAAVLPEHSFLDVTKADLETTFAINVFAIVNISQVVGAEMIKRGEGGAIVNVASILSKIAALPHCVEYTSSKGAVNMLTKCMAREFGPHKIRVNSVMPTILLTNMTAVHFDEKTFIEPFLSRHPLGEYPVTNDISDVIMFMLSERSSKMTGAEIPVDCGLMAV